MATIQRVQNKSGVSYRAIIRIAGLKPITKTFSTKRLAVAYAKRIEGNHEQAIALGTPQHSDLTLNTLVFEFLGQYTKKDKMIPQRLGWWTDHYGQLSVNEITPDLIKSALRKLSKGGKSNPTLNRYRIALSSLFNYGVDEYDLYAILAMTLNPNQKIKAQPGSYPMMNRHVYF